MYPKMDTCDYCCQKLDIGSSMINNNGWIECPKLDFIFRGWKIQFIET